MDCSVPFGISQFRSTGSLLLAIAAITALTSGCKTNPKVSYKEITASGQVDGKEFDKFVLQDSLLVIDRKKDDKGNVAFTVASIPAEYDKVKLAIYRHGSLGVKTNVVIAKIDNTEIPKEIGSEVVDKRLDLIKNIGSALVGLVGLRASGEEEEFPYRITTSPHAALDPNGGTSLPVVEHPGVFITFGSAPKDAKSREKVAFGEKTSNFYYSACRTATVELCTNPEGTEVINVGTAVACPKDQLHMLQQVKIADPSYIQSVGLPQKGKITMHSQCGVSVSTDKDSGVTSNDALLAELVTQLGKVKEAVDKKDEGEKK